MAERVAGAGEVTEVVGLVGGPLAAAGCWAAERPARTAGGLGAGSAGSVGSVVAGCGTTTAGWAAAEVPAPAVVGDLQDCGRRLWVQVSPQPILQVSALVWPHPVWPWGWGWPALGGGWKGGQRAIIRAHMLRHVTGSHGSNRGSRGGKVYRLTK